MTFLAFRRTRFRVYGFVLFIILALIAAFVGGIAGIIADKLITGLTLVSVGRDLGFFK